MFRTSRFLDLDIGAPDLKAVMFDEDGAEVASLAVEFPSHQPQPGFAAMLCAV
jgi:sugar (pentulose or hexulose) kinase